MNPDRRRIRSRITVLGIVFFAIIVPAAGASPAAPVQQSIQQPDGTHIAVRQVGDEWCNRIETLGGHRLIRDRHGWWRESDGRRLEEEPSRPASSTRRAVPAEVPAFAEACSPSPWQGMPPADSARTGVPRDYPVLMILVSFEDQLPTYSATTFAALLNDDLVDYYSTVSQGAATMVPAREAYQVQGDGVVGWLRLQIPHPDTGSLLKLANQRLARAAIRAADPYVDYGSYDTNGDGFLDSDELAIVVVTAGYDYAYGRMSPSVWAHSWWLGTVSPPEVDGVVVGNYHGNSGGYAEIGEIHASSGDDAHAATVGVLAHELGHLIFRLPDLYDIDHTSSGVGVFCLMGSGNWGYVPQGEYPGTTPVVASAHVRTRLGWCDAPTAEGPVSIRAAGSPLATPFDTVRKAVTPDAAEYFLLENREPVGYDLGMTGLLGSSFGGIAIWHINENAWLNAVDDRRLADVEEADGTEDAWTPTALWYDGNPLSEGVFDATSTPDSDLVLHRPSGVQVYGFSVPAETMSVTVATTSASDG